AHGGGRDAQLGVGVGEDVVPQPGLEVALHLRQVEVRATALVQQGFRVVEEVQSKVDERADRGFAVHAEVSFGEVPAAGAHDDDRVPDAGVERVLLAFG